MKKKINELFCSSLHYIRKKTESFINHLRTHQDSIIQVGVAPVLLLFCMYQFRMSNSRSSPKLLNEQNVAVAANLNRSCDLAGSHSKMLTNLLEVTISDNKVVNVHNLTYSTPEYLQLQSDQMDPSLVDSVITTGQDIQNQSFDVSVNKGVKARKVLHIIFDYLNRFYYIGTGPVETDPSRVELQNPVGYHRPTVFRIGDLQKSVCLPGIPKTRIIKSGNTTLEILNLLVPKSSPIKSLSTCLVKNITKGYFDSTSITRRGEDLPSHIMYWKTFVAQTQHNLMLLQIQNIIRYVRLRNLQAIIHYHLHPNPAGLRAPRLINQREMNYITRVLRANYIPQFVRGNIPSYINTDGRLLIHHDQIKSVSKGMLFEFKLLHPIFVVFKQEYVWTKYISKRFEIVLRSTQTQTMTTNMVEFQIHASGIGFEALNKVASKTPLIKRASSVINLVTSCVQEFLPIEVLIQAGHQHSPSINFNTEQEHLRTNEIYNNNLNIANNMAHNLLTFDSPLNRRTLVTNLAEIHDRNFYSVRFMIKYDFDLFGKLSKFTTPKESI